MRKQKFIPRFIADLDLFTVWHVDPCKGKGGDDTCGWFKRAWHGDEKVLRAIEKRFEFDWDRVFDSDSGNSYFRGYFKPNGDPHLSVQGIVLNLFFDAINEVYKCDGRTNWKRSKKWMAKHHFEIVMFAENPTDSLFDSITRKFEKGCGEEHGEREREERIRQMASVIYGWVLRAEQKWWQHPRWHIHHWSIQVTFWRSIKAKFFKSEQDQPCCEAKG